MKRNGQGINQTSNYSIFTLDLSQAAGTYDIATASNSQIIIEDIQALTSVAGATLTSVAIQANQGTPSIPVVSAANGAVANLILGNMLTITTSKFILNTGKKLQYVIVGTTGTGEIKLAVKWSRINSAATLS